MKKLLQASPTKLTTITNIQELQAEARRVNAAVKLQEAELREHLKKLPKEAMKLGMGNVVPSIFNSKVAGIALTAGSALLGNYLMPKTAVGTVGILGDTLKKAGIASLGKMALNWITKKRKK